METIKVRHEALQKALLTLEDGLKALSAKGAHSNEYYDLMRDGIIQRFEYSIDTFWKFFKMYLETEHGLIVEPSSPRVVLRISLANMNDKFISCDDISLDMIY